MVDFDGVVQIIFTYAIVARVAYIHSLGCGRASAALGKTYVIITVIRGRLGFWNIAISIYKIRP